MLFGNRLLRDRFLRRGGRVSTLFGARRKLETALLWFDGWAAVPAIRDALFTHIAHIILLQMRIDVLETINRNSPDELDADSLEETLSGMTPWSRQTLN